jgi:hypothetical protein
MAMTNVFTGSNGTLTLADESTPAGIDAKAVMDAYELRTVGRVTQVQVRVTTQVDQFYEIGRRHPVSLHPGAVAVAGAVGRAYVNGALLTLLLGRGAGATQVAEPYPLPAFSMSLALADPAVPGNSASLELRGVVFDSWTYGVPEEDFVMENLTFRALSISVVDKEAPAGGGEPVAKSPAFPAGGN